MLICPKCKLDLHLVERHYECAQHHCFDVAKRGYVNLLLSNQKGSGDDVEMIRARTRFLTHGYYDPLQKEVLSTIKQYTHTTIVDAGCGQGYYTNAISKECSDSVVYGFDLSKSGVDEACKAKTQSTYAVANVFHLPLAADCVDVLTSIFTPLDWNENARILRENGVFIKVGPGPKHLLDLKMIMYDTVYENEEHSESHDSFECIDTKLLEYQIEVENAQDIWALFQMTPYYWKTSKADSDKLKEKEQLTTIVQFQIEVYRKKCIE